MKQIYKITIENETTNEVLDTIRTDCFIGAAHSVDNDDASVANITLTAANAITIAGTAMAAKQTANETINEVVPEALRGILDLLDAACEKEEETNDTDNADA